MRCRYYWDLPISGHMTVFTIPGCRVRFQVAWSIIAHSSLDGFTRCAEFMGAVVGVLMVDAWFFHEVLYLETTCTGVIPV